MNNWLKEPLIVLIWYTFGQTVIKMIANCIRSPPTPWPHRPSTSGVNIFCWITNDHVWVCHTCSTTQGPEWVQKKGKKKSRECHNHKTQPFPDPKRKRKPTNPNKHKSNKRTKSTKISSLFPSLLVILSWGWLTWRIMFALNWPSIRIYQRYQSSRRGPKAGGSLHSLLASDLASPQLLDDHHLPDRRLQYSEKHRRRITHRQHYRHWRSTHQTPSQLQDHQRQHSLHHLHASRNQLHRLLQRIHVPRDRERSRRSIRINSRHSISTST